MRGYECLWKLLADAHLINNAHPSLSIRTPPVQSPTKTVSQYFHGYFDYMDMQGYLQDDSTNLNDKHELDLFIEGCVHSERLFIIAREDRLSTDPIVLQRFLQGSIINAFTSYLRELNLLDG